MYVNLANTGTQIITGNDSIVIKSNLETLEGGRSLDVTGFTPDVINAGHLLIQETSSGNIKPMPINAGATAYQALPAGHTYFGVLIASVPTKKAFAGILLRGSVNYKAAPFPMDTILAEVRTALPLILFRAD